MFDEGHESICGVGIPGLVHVDIFHFDGLLYSVLSAAFVIHVLDDLHSSKCFTEGMAILAIFLNGGATSLHGRLTGGFLSILFGLASVSQNSLLRIFEISDEKIDLRANSSVDIFVDKLFQGFVLRRTNIPIQRG